MKKYILFLLSIVAGIFSATAQEKAQNDTTFRYNKKIIHVQDSVGQVKVKVFDNDSTPYKLVYEGIFSDGKSYEKWTVKEVIDFPILDRILHKKRKEYQMTAHWAGLGWGFTNIADQNLNINNIDGLSLNSIQSNEFYINPYEKILPLFCNNIGITTGFGMGWHNYHISLDKHLVNNGDNTTIESVPDGIRYTDTRLRTFQLTVPLLLEWQPYFGNNHKSYLAAGVIGCSNVFASYKIRYIDSRGGKATNVEGKGMNVAPFSADFMLQAGYDDFGIFAKYSPFGIFEPGKGPNVRSVSVGVVLNFD